MSRAQSRFIPGDQIGAVTGWDFDAVAQGSSRFAAKLKAQAMAEEKSVVDVVRQAGFSDGYAQGFAQGQAQATLEGQRQIAEYIETQGQEAARNFAAIFASAQDQVAQQEQAMSEGVLELACELARQVLRHELRTNPNTLLPVIREALGMLAVDNRAALVRMNPLDADVFEPVLREEFPSIAITLLADANVTRGGCLVEANGTVVDGTVQKRWMRAVASLGLESAWEASDE
jgi:flagellar assembly protein FliH